MNENELICKLDSKLTTLTSLLLAFLNLSEEVCTLEQQLPMPQHQLFHVSRAFTQLHRKTSFPLSLDFAFYGHRNILRKKIDLIRFSYKFYVFVPLPTPERSNDKARSSSMWPPSLLPPSFLFFWILIFYFMNKFYSFEYLPTLMLSFFIRAVSFLPSLPVVSLLFFCPPFSCLVSYLPQV